MLYKLAHHCDKWVHAQQEGTFEMQGSVLPMEGGRVAWEQDGLAVCGGPTGLVVGQVVNSAVLW